MNLVTVPTASRPARTGTRRGAAAQFLAVSVVLAVLLLTCPEAVPGPWSLAVMAVAAGILDVVLIRAQQDGGAEPADAFTEVCVRVPAAAATVLFIMGLSLTLS